MAHFNIKIYKVIINRNEQDSKYKGFSHIINHSNQS